MERNGRTDSWLGLLRIAWPVLLVSGTMLYHLGGRLESPEQKKQRIQAEMTPLSNKLHQACQDLKDVELQLEKHRGLGGHVRMDERMKSVERRLDRLDANGT